MTDPVRTGSGNPDGRPLVLEFHDVEILRRAAQEAGWSAEYRQLGAGPLTVRSTVVQCAGISMVSQRADRSMEFVGQPPAGVLTVMIPGSGDDFWVNGYSLNDNELIVLAPGVEVYSVTRFALSACAVHIPDSLINASAGHPKSPWDDLERGWVVQVPARTGVLDSFRGLVGSSDPDSYREAELESILTRAIIPMICESPNVGPTKDRHGRAHRWQVLSRARAYIESHLGGTVRMDDLCEQAGTSLRTVERAFQQELQMTPSAYVRVRRLNAVKREIVGRGEVGKSITEIAMHYGFGHLGRFSTAYREHFGHSPSEAQRRVASWPGEWAP
jgi:AraC-like DNA-binding protein